MTMTSKSTRARIATVCQANRSFPTVDEKRIHIFGLLDIALRCRPDLVCLPESFTTIDIEQAETIPGVTIDAVAQRAREHNCYIICPILIRQEGDDVGKGHNSAIVIGRSGEIIGIYDKRWPVTSSADYTLLERGVIPGTGDGIFDLDFGRIGIRICFDVNFPEDWASLAQGQVRLVLWPSAFDGGALLNAYALLHKYWVVTSVGGERSRIIDPCGVTLAETDRHLDVVVRDINLDFAVCHYDFNASIPERIMSDYAGRVELRPHWDAATFLVEPVDPSVTIVGLMAEYGFETADQYYQRHRATQDALRQGEAARPQTAAHGNRPMYLK